VMLGAAAGAGSREEPTPAEPERALLLDAGTDTAPGNTYGKNY